MKQTIYYWLASVGNKNIPIISYLFNELRYTDISKDIWGGWDD